MDWGEVAPNAASHLLMRKVGFIVGALAIVGSANAVVVFSDGFESGDFSNWTGDASTVEQEFPNVQGAVVHTGNFAAEMQATDGPDTGTGTTGVNGKYKTVSPIAANQVVTLTFWMKLAAANGNNRHWMELRSTTTGAYTGSLDQLIAAGAYNGVTNVIDGAGNISTASSASKWQMRLALGAGYANSGWFQLNQAANRTTNWTKFEIVVMTTGVQVYVDGVAGLATPVSRGGATWTADNVILGSRLTSSGVLGYFDDVSLTAVPEPGTWAALGIGALALARKRRR